MIVRNLMLCSAILLFSLNAFAQKSQSEFSLKGGYEHFPDQPFTRRPFRSGYSIGMDYKTYVNTRFFVLATFHMGKYDMYKREVYPENGIDCTFDRHKKVDEFMLGAGIGYDLFRKERHKIYVQAAFGVGFEIANDDKKKILSEEEGYQQIYIMNNIGIDYALAASLGYDFKINDWFSCGPDISLYMIDYSFNPTFNLKATVHF